MNFEQFRRVLLQVFLVPLVALGITACALYAQVLAINHTVSLIRRSDARIAQAALAGKLIVDEETGVRGFEETGDDHFLEPYGSTRPKVESIFKALETAPGALDPNGRPYHGIAELERAYAQWHTDYADPVVAALQNGTYVQSTEHDLQGKARMDHIRAELDGVTQRAQQRRAERLTLWQQQTHQTEIALFALTLGAGALIGLFSRNRLHAVSDAYRSSLKEQTLRNEESFRSEQKLLTTLASIGDGVIACDTHCRVDLMNRVAEHLTGWTAREARGKPIEEVFPLLDEETRSHLDDPVRLVKRRNQIVDIGGHALLVQRGGSELPIATSGAPIRGQDGTMQGVVMVFRDVSLERRTQEALLAQERLASAGRLAATIAHEIHNPLDSVASLLYLMRDGGTREQMNEFLDTASSELDRVTEISRAMLGMHRESTQPIAVDLRRTLHDVLLLLRRRVLDHGITIEASLPPDIIIRGYPAELKQVFTNIITNALEAASSGGEVLVQVARVGLAEPLDGLGRSGGVEITVRDNGPGIEAHVLGTLFKPFVTTKGEHGTGLGLWVSRGIVAKHGGTLELESQTGAADHGTTARILLPLSPVGTQVHAAGSATAT